MLADRPHQRREKNSGPTTSALGLISIPILIETLWQRRVQQFRVCFEPPSDAGRPPAPAAGEKLWHKQFGHGVNLDSAVWAKAWHFSAIALVRCEAQAIDQTWTYHRVAISLSDGQH